VNAPLAPRAGNGDVRKRFPSFHMKHHNPFLPLIDNDRFLLLALSGASVLGLNIALVLVVALPFSIAWRIALVPAGVPALGYWGAAALLALAAMLKLVWGGVSLELKF
jgi:hypothetical protein